VPRNQCPVFERFADWHNKLMTWERSRELLKGSEKGGKSEKGKIIADCGFRIDEGCKVQGSRYRQDKKYFSLTPYAS